MINGSRSFLVHSWVDLPRVYDPSTCMVLNFL